MSEDMGLIGRIVNLLLQTSRTSWPKRETTTSLVQRSVPYRSILPGRCYWWWLDQKLTVAACLRRGRRVW